MGYHRAWYSILYMKPLDEVSSLCRQHHHPHSAQGTTGYNSTLARLNGSGFQDPLAPGNFFVWLHMIASVHNFWVILDLCLLLEEVSAAARRVFAQLHFGHQFQGSAHGHSPPGHLLSGLQIQGLHGSVLEQHLEASVVQTVMGAFIFSACNPLLALLCKLYQLPICFKVQLKLLVMTYKALHGMGPDYFQGYLSTVVSACLVRSSRRGMFWVLFIMEYHLVEPR